MSYLYEERTLPRSGNITVLRQQTEAGARSGGSGPAHYLNIVGSDWALDTDGNERANGPITLLNLIRYKVPSVLGRLLGRVAGVFGANGGGLGGGPGWLAPPVRYDIVTVVPDGRLLQAVLDEMGRGNIKAEIDTIFPLAEAAEAHRKLETGHVRGKVLLKIPAPDAATA